jgi:hypothetical protein
LIAIIVLGSCSSCSNYYKAVLAPQPANADSITDLKMKNRYFILRNGSEAFAMKNISISSDRKDLQCNLETVPFDHTLHLNRTEKSKLTYNKPGKAEDESPVLDEVHLYISPDSNIVASPYTLALGRIKKTEVLEEDKVKTKHNHRVELVGISSGWGCRLSHFRPVAAYSVPV